MGGGLGVASVASTAAGTAADADRPGLASGLLNTAAQLGTAVGLALLVAPAAAAGYGWGWAGAAAVAVAAALGDRRRQATSRNGPRAPLARMSSSAAAPIAPGSSRACGSASGSA